MLQKTNIVTVALPYANGDIHLGHLLEHIQADIWVRYHKILNKNCCFICADDAHGTAISIKAKEQNISPEQLIANSYKQHLTDLLHFDIQYDNYYTTHSSENIAIAKDIYQSLQTKGKVYTKTIQCFYDTVAKTFLADRFIKGVCPKCKAVDQYGDNCAKCGSAYNSTELISPYSTLSKTTPVLKESEHYFISFKDSESLVSEILSRPNFLAPEIKNKMQEWLTSGLKDWDISRDSPYFGIQIPDSDKFFYVWLDAPIGYISSFVNYCHKNNNLNNPIDLWNNADIYHFIGKDITYFHALFWPFMLHHAGYQQPRSIFVHGFLKINGQKMSKSTGNFITARQLREENINTDFIRYYLASKINGKSDDIDFSYQEFKQKVNTDLVGKFVNIFSRSASFLENKFNNMLATNIIDPALINQMLAAKHRISSYYQNLEYNKLIILFMQLTENINQYFDSKAPWLMAKDNSQQQDLHQVITVVINAYKIITIYVKPILPKMVAMISELLNIELTWNNLELTLVHHQVQSYRHLAQRI